MVQVNYVFDEALADPDALLAAYPTLTGWSEALSAAGAGRLTVVQRFRRDAALTRNGIDYTFCRDAGHAHSRPWIWPRRLHQAIADAQPDIVHVNGLIFPLQTWLLRQVLPPPSALVVQDHGSGEPHVSAKGSHGFDLPRKLRRRGLREVDGFLFSAAGQELAWRAAGVIAGQRVYHVMEASTTLRPMARAAARQASGVEGAPAVLWVGHLNANKDPLTVLDGFEMSLSSLPDATLTMIYSADDLLPAVRARLQVSPPLGARVRLVGRVSHDVMPAFYSAADVFVLGSHHEGSGYALLEACACGAVPVVTNIPSFHRITAKGSIGALWATGDARAFADALVATARRDLPAVRARMAEHFDRELGWTAIGQQAMAVYQDVLAARQARSAGGAS